MVDAINLSKPSWVEAMYLYELEQSRSPISKKTTYWWGPSAGAHRTQPGYRNPVRDALRALGVLDNKEAGIPDDYLPAPLPVRAALFAGLMDSDGSLNEYHYYPFKAWCQAPDLQLGLVTPVRVRNPEYGERYSDCLSVAFEGPALCLIQPYITVPSKKRPTLPRNVDMDLRSICVKRIKGPTPTFATSLTPPATPSNARWQTVT